MYLITPVWQFTVDITLVVPTFGGDVGLGRRISSNCVKKPSQSTLSNIIVCGGSSGEDGGGGGSDDGDDFMMLSTFTLIYRGFGCYKIIYKFNNFLNL